MILDKILMSKISIIGEKILLDAKLSHPPYNIEEMNVFLNALNTSINNNEFAGVLIGKILFSFVSGIEVRDRLSTSRFFENIFSSLFGLEPTDCTKRDNPAITKEIKSYDNQNQGWFVTKDLSGNKREKCDLVIDTYKISLKTLKGPIYSENDKCLNKDFNSELNVGSFSFMALLTDILPPEELISLADRKKGLGSGSQLRKKVFDRINQIGKNEEFLQKFALFFKYVYEEDVYIVLKSHYHIKFILIPNESFVETIINSYKNDEANFQKIFYRWENNNLRLNWKNLLAYMEKMGYPFYQVNIKLDNCFKNQTLNNLETTLSMEIEEFIKINLYT